MYGQLSYGSAAYAEIVVQVTAGAPTTVQRRTIVLVGTRVGTRKAAKE